MFVIWTLYIFSVLRNDYLSIDWTFNKELNNLNFFPLLTKIDIQVLKNQFSIKNNVKRNIKITEIRKACMINLSLSLPLSKIANLCDYSNLEIIILYLKNYFNFTEV